MATYVKPQQGKKKANDVMKGDGPGQLDQGFIEMYSNLFKSSI